MFKNLFENLREKISLWQETIEQWRVKIKEKTGVWREAISRRLPDDAVGRRRLGAVAGIACLALTLIIGTFLLRSGPEDYGPAEWPAAPHSGITAVDPETEEENSSATEKTAIEAGTDGTSEGQAEEPEEKIEDWTPKDMLQPLAGPVDRGFGFIYSPTYQDYRFHHGIDWVAPAGTGVKAAADGQVISVETGRSYGTRVILDHGGWQTVYAHLQNPSVQEGETVKVGNFIADVGSPGLDEVSEGEHLHFELWVDGEPVDPALYGVIW